MIHSRRQQSVKTGALMFQSVAAICLGASAGAVLRWWLGLSLNALFPAIPAGTLAANLLGGYGAGLAMGMFAALPNADPVWRLLVITGFLGGLTTFSTFSAEIIVLLQQEKLFLAGAAIAANLIGSLLLTVAGIATITLLRSNA